MFPVAHGLDGLMTYVNIWLTHLSTVSHEVNRLTFFDLNLCRKINYIFQACFLNFLKDSFYFLTRQCIVVALHLLAFENNAI